MQGIEKCDGSCTVVRCTTYSMGDKFTITSMNTCTTRYIYCILSQVTTLLFFVIFLQAPWAAVRIKLLVDIICSQMWCYFVKRKGYHYRKKKTKGTRKPLRQMLLRPTLCQMLFTSLLATCNLLLTASVRVATKAMQPRLVESWKCQVQHLRQFYCKQKHQQKGTSRGVYSGQLCYIPVFVAMWLIVLSTTLLLVWNRDTVDWSLEVMVKYLDFAAINLDARIEAMGSPIGIILYQFDH